MTAASRFSGLGFVFVLASALWASEAVAEPVIGVIDVQRILAEAEAAKNIMTQRDKLATASQTSAVAEEARLRAEDEELVSLRLSLPAEVMAKRRTDFQAKVVDFQKKVQRDRQDLDKAFGEAMKIIQDEMLRTTDIVAGERGMSLVLYKTQVFLFDPRMDLTDDVLGRLNKSLPSVVFEVPKKKAEGVFLQQSQEQESE